MFKPYDNPYCAFNNNNNNNNNKLQQTDLQ